jgi:hypothetical protein
MARAELAVMQAIGKTLWAIAEGYLPPVSADQPRPIRSHETACLLNTSDSEAEICITVYFSDREPLGPLRVRVPARRTKHLRFDELDGIPRQTDFATVIESSVPIVVQHTRLDARDAVHGLITTIAYSE